MVDGADPTGGALERATSAAPRPARRRTALAAVARPAGEVAGLLLVEVLGSPRAWAASLGLARSLARWLAGRRRPASAGVEVTTGAGHGGAGRRHQRPGSPRRDDARRANPGVARSWPAADQQRAGSTGQQR